MFSYKAIAKIDQLLVFPTYRGGGGAIYKLLLFGMEGVVVDFNGYFCC